MTKRIEEMMGVSAVPGIGAAPAGVDPSSAEAKKFAEPGVPPKKKKRVIITDPKAPLKRSLLKGLMGFKEWLEEDKHDVRGVTGKMVDIKKAPVRHPGGKVTVEYPGKSSSSGGGD